MGRTVALIHCLGLILEMKVRLWSDQNTFVSEVLFLISSWLNLVVFVFFAARGEGAAMPSMAFEIALLFKVLLVPVGISLLL